jgi:hypothetical protein
MLLNFDGNTNVEPSVDPSVSSCDDTPVRRPESEVVCYKLPNLVGLPGENVASPYGLQELIRFSEHVLVVTSGRAIVELAVPKLDGGRHSPVSCRTNEQREHGAVADAKKRKPMRTDHSIRVLVGRRPAF